MSLIGTIREDINAVFAGDPAARTVWEVIFCYPGLHAIWLHRLAHRVWRWKLHFLGRLVSHLSRFLTGIEIHPGARIGRRLFIDHGAGVVVGETAEIGDDVIMYQGVVLGGTSREKKKRHPTIGNRVVIGAVSVLLGPITVGGGARIGAHSVVIHPVPPDTTVVGSVAKAVQKEVGEAPDLDHARLPDLVGEALKRMADEMEGLRERLEAVEAGRGS